MKKLVIITAVLSSAVGLSHVWAADEANGALSRTLTGSAKNSGCNTVDITRSSGPRARVQGTTTLDLAGARMRVGSTNTSGCRANESVHGTQLNTTCWSGRNYNPPEKMGYTNAPANHTHSCSGEQGGRGALWYMRAIGGS
jgi:hypothetical protein